MEEHKAVIQLIYEVIDELNLDLPKEKQLEKSVHTPLFGKSSPLDSLGLVHLIVTIETKIEEELGASITIADERAISQPESPFRTVETLADYICLLLGAGGSSSHQAIR